MGPTTEPRVTLATIWQTRPHRRQADRKVAGVASAIARRYHVDPVLIRIGFVVAAFYGVGILLYLAAWIALPADPDDPPNGPIGGRGIVQAIVLVVLAVAALSGLGSLFRGDLGLVVGLFVAGGLLYLLHISRGQQGLVAARSGTGGTGGTQAGAASDPGGTPAAWDPLGAAPFARDLPEPPAAPGVAPPPDRPRSRVTLVTVGLTLLAGGITGSIVLAGGGLAGIRVVLGVMLAVVGLGLVVGAFTRGGRGLIVLAIPLVLIGYGTTRAPLQRWQGAGELLVAPTSLAGLAPSYDRTFGRVELDLRRLDLTSAGPVPEPVSVPTPGAPPAAGMPAPVPAASLGPVRTRVSLQVGDATVLLPANADVQLHCHTDLGDVNCLGNEDSGGDASDVRVGDLGRDGVAGGRPLSVDVIVGTGSVEVRRD